jgi:hypothetical protein
VGAGLASATTSQWTANCGVNLRTKPTTLSTRKTSIATGTVVTISAKVAGGSYGTSCKTYVYGSSWFAITAIGGRSVSSLYGVNALYAASALFRSTTKSTSGPVEGIDVSEWQIPIGSGPPVPIGPWGPLVARMLAAMGVYGGASSLSKEGAARIQEVAAAEIAEVAQEIARAAQKGFRGG